MKEVIMQVQSFSADYPKAPIYVGDIHYESDGWVCRIDDMVVDDTDYCSYAERRAESEVEE